MHLANNEILLPVQAMGSETGIVFMHGYGGGAFSWRHVLGPLARSTGCRVIAFDRPAFGVLLFRPVHCGLHVPASCNLLVFSLCRHSRFQNMGSCD